VGLVSFSIQIEIAPSRAIMLNNAQTNLSDLSQTLGVKDPYTKEKRKYGNIRIVKNNISFIVFILMI